MGARNYRRPPPPPRTEAAQHSCTILLELIRDLSVAIEVSRILAKRRCNMYNLINLHINLFFLNSIVIDRWQGVASLCSPDVRG